MTGRKAAIPSQRTKSSSSATSSAEREPPVIDSPTNAFTCQEIDFFVDNHDFLAL